MADTLDYFGSGTMHEPGAAKVLVLAPHMDDEVLGCGGTIARHIDAGASVAVAFLTDSYEQSRRSTENSSDEQEAHRLAQVNLRKREAKAALAILGVETVYYLDAPAGELADSKTVVASLRAVIERESPSIVYLPFFLDRHPDHLATNTILLAAAADRELECRGYEVWTPLFPNILVSIDCALERKHRALACYESQLSHTNFVHVGTGLNAFRSAGLGANASRYAEAFCRLPLREYRDLFRTWSRR